MEIKKVSEYKGEAQLGRCVECGEFETDFNRLYRFNFSSSSICLCPDCFRKTRAKMNAVDDGYISTDSTSDSRRKNCQYMTEKRDCDGDYDTYCTQSSGNCPYKRDVKDCDGDWISLCRY